jgi:uncharacterized protein YgiM (DUF1202 family)
VRSYTSAKPKTVLQVNVSYYVSATTLNLRAEPSPDAEVLRVLTTDDIVTVLELVDSKWAKVSVDASYDQSAATGYVARAYLSTER